MSGPKLAKKYGRGRTRTIYLTLERDRQEQARARTPVLDIKPYTVEFDPQGPIQEPAWMKELMRDYY